jgi:hypothetical protein
VRGEVAGGFPGLAGAGAEHDGGPEEDACGEVVAGGGVARVSGGEKVFVGGGHHAAFGFEFAAVGFVHSLTRR